MLDLPQGRSDTQLITRKIVLDRLSVLANFPIAYRHSPREGKPGPKWKIKAARLLSPGASIISTPQDIELKDVIKGINKLHYLPTLVTIPGMVQNMSLLICPHCQMSTDPSTLLFNPAAVHDT